MHFVALLLDRQAIQAGSEKLVLCLCYPLLDQSQSCKALYLLSRQACVILPLSISVVKQCSSPIFLNKGHHSNISSALSSFDSWAARRNFRCSVQAHSPSLLRFWLLAIHNDHGSLHEPHIFPLEHSGDDIPSLPYSVYFVRLRWQLIWCGFLGKIFKDVRANLGATCHMPHGAQYKVVNFHSLAMENLLLSSFLDKQSWKQHECAWYRIAEGCDNIRARPNQQKIVRPLTDHVHIERLFQCSLLLQQTREKSSAREERAWVCASS